MMRKRAFTLVEVVISIFLFSIMMIFLYKSVASLKLSNQIIKRHTQNDKIISKTISLMREDILKGYKIYTSSLQKDILSLKTLNSIHQIAKPLVKWMLIKNHLIRVERNYEIFFVNDTTLKCKDFRVLLSKKKDKILIFLKLMDNKEFIYETPIYLSE